MATRDNGVRRPRCPAPGSREILGDALIEALRRASDGTFVTDQEGRIVLWNDAAEAILGHPAAEVLGRPCCTLLCGEDLDGDPPCASKRADGAAAPGGKPVPAFDVHTRTKAGFAAWINVSVLVMADTRTGAAFMLHLFRDVTFSKEQLALAHEGLAEVSNGTAALTRREREVLGLMAEGLNTASMAQRLHVSRATVRNHVQNILLKLDVHSRLEAVAHGLRHRLFDWPRKETT